MPGAIQSLGAPGEVQLNGYPFEIVPGSYQVDEYPTTGQQIYIGPPQYQDYSPAGSAWGTAHLEAGYGLRRYSDLEWNVGLLKNYKESSNVDCRSSGVIVSPALNSVTLPGSTATPVWVGEFTPTAGAVQQACLVAVAGTKIFYSTDGNTFTDSGYTLAANAQQGAVGVFGNTLVVGFGSAHTAQAATTLDASVGLADVKNSTPSNIYIWALTFDHAACYVAGGPNNTDSFKVLSSTAAATGYTVPGSAIICGSTNMIITGLAPGGGLALVFVSSNMETGQITTNNVYQQLIDFNSRSPNNGLGMRWIEAQGGQDQSGPLILGIPRSRSIVIYSPSNQNAGTGVDIAPWSKEGFRPVNAKGLVTCLQGTPHYLYYAITNNAGHSWIIAYDTRTGASHTYLDLGITTCQTMGLTSLFGSNPQLWIGAGNNLYKVIMPQDGDWPFDDGNCTYNTGTNTLDIPDIDFFLPDESKIAFTLRGVADNLMAGAQTITVSYALDGGSYTTLGTMTTIPTQTLTFPTNTTFKRLSLRFTLTTTSASTTPVFLGFSLRASINFAIYRTWSWIAYVPAGFMTSMSPDLVNAQTTVAQFWLARRNGIPVSYVDRWQDNYSVRILHIRENPNVPPQIQEALRPNSDLIQFELLEVVPVTGGAGSTYNSPTSLYNTPWTIYG